jgi:biotin operon repressor
MARKTASFVFCDNPGCKESREIDEGSGHVPEGWYSVHPEREGKYSHEIWEFHSPLCVAKWARLRDRALNGEPITRSSPRPAEEQNDQVLEIFNLDTDESLSVTEIADLSGLPRDGVNRRVNELAQAGTIFQTVARRGPYPAKYRINS